MSARRLLRHEGLLEDQKVSLRIECQQRGFVTKRQRRAAAQQPGGSGDDDEKDSSDKATLKGVSSSSPVVVPNVSSDLSSRPTGLSPEEERLLIQPPQDAPYVNYKELYDPLIHLPSAPQDWSDYEPSTPLWEELAAQIGVLGRPMTVAEYMHHALLHPEFGYYSNPTNNASHDDDTQFLDETKMDSPAVDEEGWDIVESDAAAKDGPIFGPRGDFVTAPEICQVFGESLIVWLMTQWETIGKPNKIQLVEMGPGKGSLINDMVRFALHDKLSHFGRCIQAIHLVEASPYLRKEQLAALQTLHHLVDWEFYHVDDPSSVFEKEYIQPIMDDKTARKQGESHPTIQVYWHDTFASVVAMQKKTPDFSSMPVFVICQELFDALPVHVFEKTSEGWRERMVDVAMREDLEQEDMENSPEQAQTPPSNSHDTKKPRLRIVLAPEDTPALKTLLDDDIKAEVGQVVEVCAEGIFLIRDIAYLLTQQDGAGLIIDYGEEGSHDSLRGFLRHEQVHFLCHPGKIDVTADVDFAALRHAVNNDATKNNDAAISSPKNDNDIQAFGPISQGKFLVSMGAPERVIQLIESDSTTDEQAQDLYDALERLISPEQMGERYKVLSLARKRNDFFPPPGFG